MKLRIAELRKSYGGKRALDGISLTVEEGEIFGFIGPNGAGKTTTMSILVGLIPSDSGVCEVDGKAARGGAAVGYLPEQPVFAEQLSAREYLVMLARSMGLRRSGAEIQGLLERVSLAEAAHRRVAGYSRGMRQRLGLACALLGKPELLVLDEPSSALDPEGRRAVVDLIRELKAEGRTVILSTHILSDIERVCDRIALIDSGRILLEGAVDELLGEGPGGRTDLVFSRPLKPSELEALRALPSLSLEVGNGGSVVCVTAEGEGAAGAGLEVVRRIAELELPLVSLNPRRLDLEELFLRKVGRRA